MISHSTLGKEESKAQGPVSTKTNGFRGLWIKQSLWPFYYHIHNGNSVKGEMARDWGLNKEGLLHHVKGFTWYPVVQERTLESFGFLACFCWGFVAVAISQRGTDLEVQKDEHICRWKDHVINNQRKERAIDKETTRRGKIW